MSELEKESYYAILEAIQVLEHYNTGEDFPLVTSLRRLRDLKAEFEKKYSPFQFVSPQR